MPKGNPGVDMTDIEIVAHVQGWNMAPKGLPSTRHRLYYLDYRKGWVYLTGEGQRVYVENKQAVDAIVEQVHQPAVESWAKRAVETLTSQSSSEPTVQCPHCKQDVSAFVDAGGVVVRDGKVQLLQVLIEDGDIFIPLEETHVSLREEAECSECNAKAPLESFIQPSDSNVKLVTVYAGLEPVTT